ncbi:MAG: ABC transporter ATP-binding protein [Defluviitaleaceae bacterium]|nr:ABC transporter ATP-binding protein [Defluviitaleaceae bacterium]
MKIILKDLKMEFDKVQAIKGINIIIEHGKLVSLLGPSGCGKSTTLMMLAGLYRPTSGQIFFGDKDVTKIEAEHRGIGMVFQNYALYPHLSILKNIMFPLKMKKVPKAEAISQAMEVAKLVKIDHLVDRKPGQLSGGQQQRVAIARALVKKPELLLLDEPLSNLDAHLRLEMREEIRRIQLEVGITAVFVTHDQEEAMSISDKVILMNAGEIVQTSAPQEMYKNPNCIFAAEFIGSPPMNLLENKGKIAGIRPEDFFVSDKSQAYVSGKVTHIETIGRDTLLKVASDERILTVLLGADTNIKLNEEIHLGVQLDKIHNFDVASGRRI